MYADVVSLWLANDRISSAMIELPERSLDVIRAGAVVDIDRELTGEEAWLLALHPSRFAATRASASCAWSGRLLTTPSISLSTWIRRSSACLSALSGAGLALTVNKIPKRPPRLS